MSSKVNLARTEGSGIQLRTLERLKQMAPGQGLNSDSLSQKSTQTTTIIKTQTAIKKTARWLIKLLAAKNDNGSSSPGNTGGRRTGLLGILTCTSVHTKKVNE